MEIQKLVGYNRIYQAECFPDEVKTMFGKNTGEMRRYFKWLYAWLHILDAEGLNALNYEQFEQLKGTEKPYLYAIRHPHSVINERYLYIYMGNESTVLLTAFMEKDKKDYSAAIKRAQNIYAELEE